MRSSLANFEAAIPLACLTHLRFRWFLFLVNARFRTAPYVIGDAIWAEDAPARNCRRCLRVKSGEDVMTGVLAPNDDPGH